MHWRDILRVLIGQHSALCTSMAVESLNEVLQPWAGGWESKLLDLLHARIRKVND